MAEEPATRSPRVRYSKSPKLSSSVLEDSSESDNSQMTSDENNDYDDDPIIERLPNLPKKLYPNLENLSHRKPRCRSRSPLNIQYESGDKTFNIAEEISARTYRKNIPNDKLLNRSDEESAKRKETSSPKIKPIAPKSSQTNNINAKTCFACLCFSIIVSVCVWFTVNAQSASSLPEIEPLELRLKTFTNDLRRVQEKFPNQNSRTWLDIKAGITDVINGSMKPWTFVLFSNEIERISCLAELLGIVSSKALLSNRSLILNPADFGNEYGDAIDRLRPLIMEKKVVVVHDVLNIDPGAIQAFHTMCDRENPLVNEAIYILTIIAPGYSKSERAEAFVENQLTKRFVNKVDDDKLQPLITRLTDGPIIPVVPGNKPIGCSL